jgi:CDGSH-type Zn-finger protein
MSDFAEIKRENPRVCTCGRSATGFCTGLHKLTNEQWDARVFDEAFLKEEKKDDESES